MYNTLAVVHTAHFHLEQSSYQLTIFHYITVLLSELTIHQCCACYKSHQVGSYLLVDCLCHTADNYEKVNFRDDKSNTQNLILVLNIITHFLSPSPTPSKGQCIGHVRKNIVICIVCGGCNSEGLVTTLTLLASRRIGTDSPLSSTTF